jgi:hypothetical protein
MYVASVAVAKRDDWVTPVIAGNSYSRREREAWMTSSVFNDLKFHD